MQWIADTAEALGFINLDRRHEIEKSLVAFNDYVAALLAERHSSPQEDFLSEYVVATAQDGELSEAEIRTQIVGLILAGSDTTRGSLCMTLAYLLQHGGGCRRRTQERRRILPIESGDSLGREWQETL